MVTTSTRRRTIKSTFASITPEPWALRDPSTNLDILSSTMDNAFVNLMIPLMSSVTGLREHPITMLTVSVL